MIKPIQQCGHAGQCGEGHTFGGGDGFFFQPEGEGCSASAGGNDRPEYPPPARREVKIVPQPAGFWIAAHGDLYYSDRRQKADTVEQATLVLARNSVGLRCNPSPPVVAGGLRFAPSTDEAFSKVTSYAIPLYPNCSWRLMTHILLFSDISGAYGLRERLFTLLFVPTESLFQILCHREDDDPLAIPDADVSMQTLDLTARLFLNNCFQQRARTFQKLPPHLLYQAVPLSRLRQTHFRWRKYAAQTDENHILNDDCAGFCRSPAQVFFFKLNNCVGEGGLDFTASGLGHGKRLR